MTRRPSCHQQVRVSQGNVAGALDVCAYNCIAPAPCVTVHITPERQKAFYARKRLAWDVEATFTKVYAAHHGRPSDDMVRSLAELHRLPRRRVIDWFTAKRAEEFEARKQRRGSGKHRGPDQQRQPRQDTPTRGQQRE